MGTSGPAAGTQPAAPTTAPAGTPAATEPTTAPAAPIAPTTGPTTVPTTVPATLPTTGSAAVPVPAAAPELVGPPPPPPSKWVLASEGGFSADDDQVRDLLDALHPMRVEKYLATPSTQPATQPSAEYVLSVKTIGAGGADTATFELRITDPGGEAKLIGHYNDLTFELDRSLLKKLDGDFKTKKPPEPISPAHRRLPRRRRLPGRRRVSGRAIEQVVRQASFDAHQGGRAGSAGRNRDPPCSPCP